nr:ankyrin repeat domain-containing protein 12-like [Procambarus clarkii]
MSMLAEPRRKQRWSLNPRGSLWANDDQKFGQKLMEKMGWSKGKGLGREEQGHTEHISVRCKDDNKGLGYKGKDDEWIKHYEGFENVLAMLNSEHNSAANSKTNSASNSSAVSDEETEEKDVKSLEARSKVSRARVHYHKFTRGKDLSRYNDDDIACILGSKRAKIAKAKSIEESTSIVDEIGHVDKLNGVTTIKGCSVQDYFAKKMAALKRKTVANTSAMETNTCTEEKEDFEARAEDGFDLHTENEEVNPNSSVNYIERNAEDTESKIGRGTLEVEENKENPKKKKKRKKEREGLEQCVVGTEETFGKNKELQESIEGEKRKRKKKKKGKGENNESCESLDSPAEVNTEKKSKKKKKILIEDELDAEYSKLVEMKEICESHLKKKKKKKRDPTLGDNIHTLNEEESVLEFVEQSSHPDKVKKKRKRESSECANKDSMDPDGKPKNRNKKTQGSLLQDKVNSEMCHEDIDNQHSDNPKKKKKKNRKQTNEEGDYFAQKMAASKNKVLPELPAEENVEENKPVVRKTLGINVCINSSNEEEETHNRDHKTFRTKKGSKRKHESSLEDKVEVEECCQKKQRQELSSEKESLSPKLKYKKINNSFDRGNVEDVSMIRNNTITHEDECYIKHGKKKKKYKNYTDEVVSQESDIEETVAGNKKKRKKAKLLENEGCQFPERDNIEQLEKSVKKRKKKLSCRDQSEKQEINQTSIFISDAANAESHGRKKKKKRENIPEQSEGNIEVTNYKDGNIPNDLHQIQINDKEKGKINNKEEQDKEKKEQVSLEDVETEPKKQNENSHLLCNQFTANFNDKKNKIWLDLDVIKFSESSIYPEARESLEIRSKRRSKNNLEIMNKVIGIHKLFRKNPDRFVEDLGPGIDENRLSDSSSIMNSKTKTTRLDLVDRERTVANPDSKAEKEGYITHSWQSDLKCLEGDQEYVEDRVTNKQYELASSNIDYVNVEKVKSKCDSRNGTSIDIEFKSALKENDVNSNYEGKFCSNLKKDSIIMAKSKLKTKEILAVAEAFKGANLLDCRGYETKARQEALEDVVPEGQLKNCYLKPKKKEFIKDSHLLSSKNISPEEKKNWLSDNVMNLAESRVCPGRKSKILVGVGAHAFKGANLWQCKGYETKATKETLGDVEPERDLKHNLKPKKREFTKNKKNKNQLIKNVTTLSESRACPENNDPSERCKKQSQNISDLNSKLSIINKMFRKKLDDLANDISNKNISHENNFMGSETKSTPLDCIEKNKKVVYFKSTSDRGESRADSCWESGMAPQVHKVDQVNVAAKDTIKHESGSLNTNYVTKKKVRSKCDTRIQNDGNKKQFMNSDYESCTNVRGMNRTRVGKFRSGKGKNKHVSKNYLSNNEILSGAQAFKGANLWQFRGYDI